MIRFSVYYPKTEGASFDHDYYRDSHVPLAMSTWGLAADQVDYPGLSAAAQLRHAERFSAESMSTRVASVYSAILGV